MMRSLWILAGVTIGALAPPPMDFLLPWLAALLIAAAIFTRHWGPLLLVAGAALTHGLIVAEVQAQLRCEERVLAQVQVIGVPSRGGSGWRFEALVKHPREPGRADVRAVVEMPGFGGQRPAVGETWQLLLRYRPIPDDADGGVDALRIAVRDHRQASARAMASPLNQRLATARGISIDALRERVAQRIQRRALDPSAGALLAALAVGVTGEVTNRQWRDFSATGITHLVAISGGHVTFFALLSMAAVRRLWNVLPALQRRVNRERLAGIAGVALATAYALLSGFSVPAQRTMLMLAVFVLWRETARTATPCWSLAVAMCAVLAIDPLAILGAGFWLSFAAVAAILLLPGSRLGKEGAMRSGARVQFAVSLSLLPFTVLLFGSFSFSGLLVNAAAIPLFGFVLVPGALLAALAYLLPGAAAGAVGDLLVDCTGAVAAWMLPWLGRVAQWDASTWLGQMPLPQLLLAGLAALACLLPLRLSVRLPALALVITGFIGAQTPPAPGAAQLAVLGTGSETSVIVTTATHRLVFGAGEVNGGDGRRFRTRVIEYLQRQGGPDVELLVIGRPRAERLAAVTAAAARWPSVSIIGEPANQPLPPEIERCEQREWEWDDVSFTLMTPDTGKGCALAIRAGAGSALLTLDVDEPGWRALLRRDDVDANFVMLPPSATRFFQSQSDEGGEGTDGSNTWLLTQRQDTDASRRRWEQLRDQASRGGQHLLDASTLPAQRVTLGTDAAHPVQLRPLQRWRWGAWSGRLPAANCSPG